MRVASIGFFCAEYPISLANALAKTNTVTLLLSRQNLSVRFPGVSDLEALLRERQIIEPDVSLRLIDYPTGRYLYKLRLARDIVHAIDELQPDVVHYQSGGDPWIPLVMPLLRRFPLVATIHDATAHTGDRPSKPVLNLINALVTRLAHQIIVHGQQQASSLVEVYHTPSGKVNVIPMGVLSLFKVPADGQAPQDSQTILFFGRIRGYKGVEVLIRATPLIAEHIPDVRVVIAGSGNCEALHRATEEHPEWFEVHNRFISADEVPGLFRRAALVVLPYLDATQSAVVPLAYLFGRPIVSTRVGSIPEIVDDGKTGCLVEPGDERALANAIVRLLRDRPVREAMGRAAAVKLERDLSWNAIATKTLAVYECARACASNAPLVRKEVP